MRVNAPTEVILLLGDSLFAGLPGMPEHVPILMREDEALATGHRHHRQKIVLFFSAMRHFAERLRRAGREVRYRRWGEKDGAYSVLQMLEQTGAKRVWAYDPPDRPFAHQLRTWAEENGVDLRLIPSPMFLTYRTDWEAWSSGRGRFLMGDFYSYQRRRLGLLLDDQGLPLGGSWSKDTENRRALPRAVLPPPLHAPEPDAITREVMDLVDAEFPEHYGKASEFAYAVTHEDAATWLGEFIEERLERFGPYEDAIPSRERVLFHGVLTPYLNCGLLTPAQVVEAALRRNALAPIPLNSLEGFIRQVVGWREFIRWTDHDLYESRGIGTDGKNWPNALNAQRRLKQVWWTGETGLPPLDTVIRRALQHGWTHHIERLMVAGAVMTMVGIHPDDEFRWFMEMYVDSADWVMGPNVYGMAAFADGGLFATKPYISGSSYILKMGDATRGSWCDVWDGLYWGFVLRHREILAKNPRASLMVRGAERLEPRRRDRLLASAAEFIARVSDSPAE